MSKQNLIDVDKLVNDIAEHITVKAVSRVLAIIQGQPTVDAIPVGWLKTHGGNLVTKPDRKFTSENMAFLYTLIAEWRERNEQRKDS